MIFSSFFFASFFLVEHLCIIPNSLLFPPKKYNKTSKSGARTDTCDCLCYCLLLFTLFSILLARTTSGRLWSWCSGLTFLSTYWCKVLRPLCLAGSFRLLLLLLPLLMLFLFLISSLALWFLFSVFPVCTDSSALSLVTFSSPSPRGELLLFDVSFSLTQSFTFCCYFCCIIYMSIPTFQLAHYCWLVVQSRKLSPIS